MVPLPTFADNVGVDVVTGHLWVAVHPDAQLFVNHMSWPHAALAPSQVQWIPRACPCEPVCLACVRACVRACVSVCPCEHVCLRVRE